MHYPTDRIAHTTAFVTPVVEHWLEQEIAQWVKECMKPLSFILISNYHTLVTMCLIDKLQLLSQVQLLPTALNSSE